MLVGREDFVGRRRLEAAVESHRPVHSARLEQPFATVEREIAGLLQVGSRKRRRP